VNILDGDVGTQSFIVRLADEQIPNAATPRLIPHPASLRLGAYPNPFNATTTLTLELPQSGAVTLAVYDLLGREVTRLWNGELAAGEHQFRLDGGGLPSGLYLAKLEALGAVSVHKLVLLK
jgi:hypothetical protein